MHLWKRARGLLALVALFLLTSVALAQTGAPYDLTWSTIDGGGEPLSTGGVYALGGTIGQPDAGFMQGGDYTLGGGFWGGGDLAPPDFKLYMPLVLRN
ncbi:MAG: hypothetical protein KKA73_17155 [Chloroflexi bacterium]|nr:hypothetical protein [Chloroflexota bacterium]MBU1749416.1 hypothetical protein [Chloroflexota bacterium]